MSTLSFAHETPRRLRTAFLGTSGHAFRNYLPSLPYAPVELVAVWDADAARAEAFARQFGAPRWYGDLDRLLDEARPEAVLIATDGRDGDEPRNAGLMARCLEHGCHAWCDKPVAASAAGAARLIDIRDRVGKVAGVGIKTMFYPAHQRVREIVRDPAFGRPVTMTVRYPLHIPSRAGLSIADRAVGSCLSHLWHPFGAALAILGRIEQLHVEAAPAGGGGVAVARFAQGAAGAFHFSAGRSGTSPLEFLEVVGEGANVTVENAARLTWYRPAHRAPTVVLPASSPTTIRRRWYGSRSCRWASSTTTTTSSRATRKASSPLRRPPSVAPRSPAGPWRTHARCSRCSMPCARAPAGRLHCPTADGRCRKHLTWWPPGDW